MQTDRHVGMLRDIVDIYDGPHATPRKTASGPYFLGISNLAHGRIDLSDSEHLSEEDFKRWTRRVMPSPGDLVFSYETRLGEAALIPKGLRGCLGRRMGLLRVRDDSVNTRYLLYAYLSPEFQETIRERTVHGSTVDRIPLVDMPNFPIKLPDRRTQDAIAEILGSLDDKIELNRKMSATLEAVARALFKSWFVDFDPVRAKAEGRDPGLPDEIAAFFPGSFEDSEIGEVPRGWRNLAISNLAELIKGKSYSSCDLKPSNTALVSLKCIRRGGGYNADGLKPYAGDYKASQVIGRDDLVMACTDITQAAEVIGRTALVLPDERYSTLIASLDLLIIRLSGSMEAVTREFLHFSLSTERFVEYAYAHTSGTTVLHLATGAVPSYTLPIPTQPLLRLFGRIAEPLMRRGALAEIESRTLSQLRDALLPKLISGEIRVSEAERIVEKSA